MRQVFVQYITAVFAVLSLFALGVCLGMALAWPQTRRCARCDEDILEFPKEPPL